MSHGASVVGSMITGFSWYRILGKKDYHRFSPLAFFSLFLFYEFWRDLPLSGVKLPIDCVVRRSSKEPTTLTRESLRALAKAKSDGAMLMGLGIRWSLDDRFEKKVVGADESLSLLPFSVFHPGALSPTHVSSERAFCRGLDSHVTLSAHA